MVTKDGHNLQLEGGDDVKLLILYNSSWWMVAIPHEKREHWVKKS